MLIEPAAGALLVRAPAKVNVFLEVLGKRADGYHEIATLMVAVSLYDTVEVKEAPAGEVRLSSDDPVLPVGADNLVHRAAALLQARTQCGRGAHMHLYKRIPMAAGLAGGSSDAAAALVGLNQVWQIGLSTAQLAGVGAELGSDVPFFFSTPAAWCTGRGEHVEPLMPARPLWFVLACPSAGLSTARVYERVRVPAKPLSGEAVRIALRTGGPTALSGQLHNRLQEPALELCPDIRALLERLKATRPLCYLMTGSGSAAFALCKDRHDALRVARLLRHGAKEDSRLRVFVVSSCP
jgi:4-diphosphocytidyl-2-C-methyl-D-erythritol kinase